MERELPPLEELQSLRQQLIDQIASAEKLFCHENNGHELLTSKDALKCIEEIISHADNEKPA